MNDAIRNNNTHFKAYPKIVYYICNSYSGSKHNIQYEWVAVLSLCV